MSVQVKICGLRSAHAMDAALEAGADYVGLVFYEPSPRNVGIVTARALRDQAQGRARSVALMVDPDDAFLDAVLSKVDPDIIQLHGKETPERVGEVKARADRPVIKAVKIGASEDIGQAERYTAADFILFDAQAPAGMKGALPGGNGVPFDWEVFAAAKKNDSFILSGGLNADNVSEAVRITGADFVDVSSGVESSPGEKDPDLIRRFISAAKSIS